MDLHLVVNDTERVFELFPGVTASFGCAYWIGVSRISVHWVEVGMRMGGGRGDGLGVK